MKNIIFLLFTTTLFFHSSAQDSDSPLVSFEDYEMLMSKVKVHRQSRLVPLDEFNRLHSEENYYILDTRSKEMYDRKHVKGAIHMNFSDFTQANLDSLFPSRDAKILIYCNNNFVISTPMSLSFLEANIDQNFASKVSYPNPRDMQLQIYDIDRGAIDINELGEPIETTEDKAELVEDAKPITLALNIPTYINLYGYGYKNVFELSELVSVNDPRIQFEGTEVNTAQLRVK